MVTANKIFKIAEEHLLKQLPFVLYAAPEEAVVHGIFGDGDASTSGSGFVFASFDRSRRIVIPFLNSECVAAEFNPLRYDHQLAFAPSEHGKKDFMDLVEDAVREIQEGRFAKVVLSRKEPVEPADESAVDYYQRVLSEYPDAFRYLFFHPEAGTWLGATPELLLKSSARTFNTVALAGTQKTDSDEVQWQQKEVLEQQFVTDFIADGLQDISSELKIGAPNTHRAGSIVHIKTEISGKLLPSVALEQVVEKLHPTPAVCGLPRDSSMSHILSNEGYDREFYSGYLGILKPEAADEQAELYVNLRCMKLEGGKAILFMGCGITAESDPEKEYIETVNKSMTMKKIVAPIL